jgi:selenocysteine-specific elongation factor
VKGKIRTIQSHSQQVDIAYPGQRTAVSLTGIDKEYLSRGSVITTSKLVSSNLDEPVLCLNLELLPESPVIIENKRSLLLIVGTSEVEGEIRLLDKHPITPGMSGVALFKPFQPILALVGDRFIARLPTPSVTVGGGLVLDHLDRVPRANEFEDYKYLKDRIDLTVEILVETEIRKKAYIDPENDLVLSDFDLKEIIRIINTEVKSSRVMEYDGKYYDSEIVEGITGRITAVLESYFEKNPHIEGLTAEAISRQVGHNQALLNPILDLAQNKGRLDRNGPLYNLPNREVSIKGDYEALATEIENALLTGKYTPPKITELTGKDKKRKETFNFLIKTGKAVKISSEMAFHAESWKEIVGVIHTILKSSGQFTVAVVKEKLGCSRKYLMPILEETDRLGITAREGDYRVKGDKFEETKNLL